MNEIDIQNSESSEDDSINIIVYDDAKQNDYDDNINIIVYDNSKQNNFDSDSDEDYNECVINSNVTTKIICDSINKDDDITQCIGTLEVLFIPDSTLNKKEMMHGTGTVIHIDNKNIIYILTAAHNLCGVERKCVKCNSKTLKRICQNNECGSNVRTQKTGKLIQPADIQFVRRENKKPPPKLGECITTYAVHSYEIHSKYKHFPTAKSGYDIGIISFECHDKDSIALYGTICPNLTLVNDPIFSNYNCSLFIYGYPGSERKVRNNRVYYVLEGMGTSVLHGKKKSTFYVTKNDTNNQSYIVNKEINTGKGQSGSAIYSYNGKNRKQFLIYGVHTGGSMKERANYGTILDDDTLKWIKKWVPMSTDTGKMPKKKNFKTTGAHGLLAKLLMPANNKGKTDKKPPPPPPPPAATNTSKINIKKKSSYKPPKSCELIEENNKGTKKIKLFQQFDKFFTAKPAYDTKGFEIQKMKVNAFGNALVELGIGSGWKITQCANKNVRNKWFLVLKQQIRNAAIKNGTNGYIVIFENTNIPKTETKTDEEILKIYSQLINMGFQEEISLKAASKHPKDLNKAMNYVVQQTTKQPEIYAKTKNPKTLKIMKKIKTKNEETLNKHNVKTKISKKNQMLALSESMNKCETQMKLVSQSANETQQGLKQISQSCSQQKTENMNALKLQPETQQKQKIYTKKSIQKTKNNIIITENMVVEYLKKHYKVHTSNIISPHNIAKNVMISYDINETMFDFCPNQLGKVTYWIVNNVPSIFGNIEIPGQGFKLINSKMPKKKNFKTGGAHGLLAKLVIPANDKCKSDKHIIETASKNVDMHQENKEKHLVIAPPPSPPPVEINHQSFENFIQNNFSNQSKKKTKSNSVYKPPKSCELIEENNKRKKIKLFQQFDKFFTAKAAHNRKGFAIEKMKANEFGNALSQFGIGSGWKITECANKKLGNKAFVMLKHQILSAAMKNRSNGYIVVFENPKK